MFFVAQLWKCNDNGKRLENKNGDWRYMRETLILPIEWTLPIDYRRNMNKDQVISNSQWNSLNTCLDSKGTMNLEFNRICQGVILVSTCIFFAEFSSKPSNFSTVVLKIVLFSSFKAHAK